jgi:LysM repeat protein
MPQYSWPVYVVQQGDSLSAIASITASSVPELMLANCLPDTRIYTRQQLYVPRLPTPIPTDTPTDTPIIPTNGPTVFQNPSVCYDTTIGTQKLSYSIFITITPYDLEGISSLLVSYRINGGEWNQLPMTSFGNYYGASAWLTSVPTRADLVYYIFQATDNVGNVQKSYEQSSAFASCTVIN